MALRYPTHILDLRRQGFSDRQTAGIALARRLKQYAGRPDVIVLALPRGGVPVAYEVARALDVPLDVFAVRKLGLPGHEELAIGAVASGGIVLLNRDMIEELGVADADVRRVLALEQEELERRERRYRDDRPRPKVTGKVVIVVDDGLATGSTMLAALEALKRDRPVWLVVAVPIGARDTCKALQRYADEVVCAVTPEPFQGVGMWYEDFGQTSDEEVSVLVRRAHEEWSRTHDSPHEAKAKAS